MGAAGSALRRPHAARRGHRGGLALGSRRGRAGRGPGAGARAGRPSSTRSPRWRSSPTGRSPGASRRRCGTRARARRAPLGPRARRRAAHHAPRHGPPPRRLRARRGRRPRRLRRPLREMLVAAARGAADPRRAGHPGDARAPRRHRGRGRGARELIDVLAEIATSHHDAASTGVLAAPAAPPATASARSRRAPSARWPASATRATSTRRRADALAAAGDRLGGRGRALHASPGAFARPRRANLRHLTESDPHHLAAALVIGALAAQGAVESEDAAFLAHVATTGDTDARRARPRRRRDRRRRRHGGPELRPRRRGARGPLSPLRAPSAAAASRSPRRRRARSSISSSAPAWPTSSPPPSAPWARG